MNCSPRLRSVLGVASRWLGMSDIECPVLYHHLALVSYLMSSWRLGGSGSALAEAFASRFEELGGVLFCGDPAVTILASGNGVMGVKLASGRVLDTARIVAAIHPKTVLPMLPEGAVTPRYARRIMGLDDTEGMVVANVAEEAAEIFGPLSGAKVLDAYTPLTIRDWVNSPQGSPYGIMRSSHQLHAATFLHHVNLKGLFFAGQNALSPGALGTLLGSFQTVRQMIGHDRFARDVFETLSRDR